MPGTKLRTLLALTLCGISLIVAESALAFDHGHKGWAAVLIRFVSGPDTATRVDYAGLKRDPAQLNEYLGALSAVKRAEFDRWSMELQLAFLINAYNAFTLKLIIDHYPLKSIKRIGSLFKNAWKKEFFTLLGGKRHLDWIEHDMLRAKYPEPRIHFAIVCASKGCPPLRKEPYVGERVIQQLEDAATAFLRDPNSNRYDAKTGTLRLSRIFDWFGRDFDAHATSVKGFVARRMAASEEESKQILDSKKIEFLEYDWSLNEAPSAR